VATYIKDTTAVVGRTTRGKNFSTRDPEIGDLEADVLKTLKRLGSASAGEMMVELKPARVLAYTTVSTTLDRLHRKGMIARKSVAGRTGNKYVYSFPGNPGLEKQVVNRMVDRLVNAFGPSVASTIYDRLSEVSPEEAARLRESIDARVKQRRRRVEGQK
jgi:predicted transcriptional regulator